MPGSAIVVNDYGIHLIRAGSSGSGVVATDSETTVTGGTSSLVLNDSGATFSNSSGGPIQVHGVADGTAPTDAVNVRQLDAGLARSVAISGLPQIRAGKNNAFGVAFGMNGEGYAVAIGGQHHLNEHVSFKYAGSSDIWSLNTIETFRDFDSENFSYSATAGLGVSW